MNEKVFKVLIAQLEEAAVYNFIHKNEVWLKQLEKSKKSILKTFREQQNEIEEWKQDSEMYQEYLDREKDVNWLLKERTKHYEVVLTKIVTRKMSMYLSEGHMNRDFIKIAKEALENNQMKN